jgi:hypothetical protein
MTGSADGSSGSQPPGPGSPAPGTPAPGTPSPVDPVSGAGAAAGVDDADLAEWYAVEEERAAWAERWEPPSEEELSWVVFDPDNCPPDGWEGMSAAQRRELVGPGGGADEVEDLLVAPGLDAGFTHGLGGTGTGFAAGGPVDAMLPGAELAWHAGQVRRCGLGVLSDDEVCGLIGVAARLESWAAELKLAAVGELDARRAGPDGREGAHVAEEVAAVLTLTGRSATALLELVWGLERLPATRAMLAAGLIDVRRAGVIAEQTAVLPAGLAVAVQDAVLPKAAEMTSGQLAAACQKAVRACDPQAAIRRREQARKDARVESWAEPAGTAALAGRDLDPVDVIAAGKALDADARWLKAHGVPGSCDQLRAAAYTARLTGQPLASLLPPATGSAPAAPAAPAGVGGSVNLTMPAAAWLGRSDSPGEITGTGPAGPADADTCRGLAVALAASPATRWCLTLLDRRGRAVAHGCARHGPGPPGAGWAGWLTSIKITPLAAGICEHRRQSASYQPPGSLRHVIKIRSRRCGFPGCRRPATRCDDDHTIPYHKGGRTCECNLYPLCRLCRRRHNTHYADVVVMPMSRLELLVAAGLVVGRSA